MPTDEVGFYRDVTAEVNQLDIASAQGLLESLRLAMNLAASRSTE
jgi:hypothetical protein